MLDHGKLGQNLGHVHLDHALVNLRPATSHAGNVIEHR